MDSKQPINQQDSSYVLYDGSCGFCNSSALWIARNDVDHHFLLISNGSAFGKNIIKGKGLLKTSSHALILITTSGHVFIKSEAINQILSRIPGHYFLKLMSKVIPFFIQNWVYDLISLCRKWIPVGKTCRIPEENLRNRFRNAE